MSGMAGILWKRGASGDPAWLESLLAAMAPRGPDGRTTWMEPGIALGHCALRTLPDDDEVSFPLLDEIGNLVLIGDVRIDNRERLAGALDLHGQAKALPPDAAIVLAAYARWGDGCVNRLIGDFAFAIWDRTRRRLFCARDAFGVRPFHYVSGPEYFAFASDEEPLLRLPGVSHNLNEDRIAYVLVPGFEAFDFNVGWFRDIRRVGPGQTLAVAAQGKVEISTYWRPEPLDESRFSSDAECDEALREVLTASVRDRLRARGPCGSMLSGGIDSASIVGSARHLLAAQRKPDLHTFSTVSDDADGCSETRNIMSVLGGGALRSHFVSVPSMTGEASLDDLLSCYWDHAHPVDHSLLLPAMMYRAAQRAGVRVVLDGIDGDLVMSAPDNYVGWLFRQGRWKHAIAEARASVVNNAYLAGTPLSRLILRSVWFAAAPQALRSFRRTLMRPDANTLIARSIINPDFAKRIRLGERLREESAAETAASRLDPRARHAQLLDSPGIVRGMEGYDRVAAHYGIEPRHPWSDRRVVEFFLRSPLHQMAREGWTKYALRRAMAPWIPSQARWWRGKDHLGWKLTRRVMDASGERVGNSFHDIVGSIAEYVDLSKAANIYAEFKAKGCAPECEEVNSVLALARLANIRRMPARMDASTATIVALGSGSGLPAGSGQSVTISTDL